MRGARKAGGTWVSNDHWHGLPARVACNVWIGEILRCGRRGEGDDQGDGDQKLLHLKSPLACWLALRAQGSGRMAMVRPFGTTDTWGQIPPFAQYLVAIDRVHRMHRIAFSYQVKSQTAFPSERPRSDPSCYRRGSSCRPEH